MSQVNATQDQSELSIVRDVLHRIAHDSDPGANLQFVLETLCEVLGASAGGLFLFEDPQDVVLYNIDADALPESDVSLVKLADQLDARWSRGVAMPEDITVFRGYVVCHTIRVKDQTVALLALSCNQPLEQADIERDVVKSIADSLLMVIKHVRLVARHEKLSRNQSEFLRIVSHDLRSPLTSMKGFAGMLEALVAEDPQQAHFVDKILSGISQMTSQIDNFQDAGRYDPETGFYEMERHLCDVADLVSRIVDNHLVPAEKQELSVTTNSADNIPIINADVNMLERAIINLVDNAIKYTPNGGKIEVGVFLQSDDEGADRLLIRVSDTGYGISPEDQKMLFERHVRIRREEHKRVKGSGLGLFIVRSVAQRHSGDAWVESEIGSGSIFNISIPLAGDNLIV